MNEHRPIRRSRPTFTDQEALQFHSQGRPGKLEVVPTKPMATQRDLSLAYSPGVAVPVNADIPGELDVSFVDEYDDHASLIGAKGIGELGATGVDAAVAAAVHDAVRVRVRDLPILPWKVLAGLPS